MSPSHQERSPIAMRRHDRAQDEAWIREFIERAAIGTVATASGDQPFLNTNLFVYDRDRHVIYLHTARTGRLRQNLEENDRVCFTATEMGRLLPADTALEFSVEYAGVVAFGRGRVVEEAEEQRHALELLLRKYAPHLQPGHDYRGVTDDELARTAVFRIEIEAWSGKRKSAESDFPGAYLYPGDARRGEEDATP